MSKKSSIFAADFILAYYAYTRSNIDGDGFSALFGDGVEPGARAE